MFREGRRDDVSFLEGQGGDQTKVRAAGEHQGALCPGKR